MRTSGVRPFAENPAHANGNTQPYLKAGTVLLKSNMVLECCRTQYFDAVGRSMNGYSSLKELSSIVSQSISYASAPIASAYGNFYEIEMI